MSLMAICPPRFYPSPPILVIRSVVLAFEADNKIMIITLNNKQ
jgi:hypothetical protein